MDWERLRLKSEIAERDAKIAALEAVRAAGDALIASQLEGEPDDYDESCCDSWCHFCGSHETEWIGPEGYQREIRKHGLNCVWQAYRAATARLDGAAGEGT